MNSESTFKIFIPYNKRSCLFKSDFIVPIHVGRELSKLNNSNADQEWLFSNMIGDDSGENLSSLNPFYNELTAIYWVWKNYNKIGAPDFVGFQHYRRFLCFNPNIKNSPDFWTYNFSGTPSDFLKKIDFSEDAIKKSLKENDGIVSVINTPGLSVTKQYSLAEVADCHISEDLKIIEDIVRETRPDMVFAMQQYFSSCNHHFGNIFILKKELFFEYCNFIFPVLQIFLKKVDFSNRSDYQKRLFVSERLTGIFFEFLKIRGFRIDEVPVALLETPFEQEIPEKAFSTDSVNCVFSVDDRYLPKLAVCLTSLLKHSSPGYNYDFVILHSGLNEGLIAQFLQNFPKRNNVSIRFLDITPSTLLINKKDLYIEISVTVATYYRFFIQNIFKNYQKVLYLDCDIVVLDDISKLFFYNLEGNYIGAVRDVRENLASKLRLKVSNNVIWPDYVKNVVRLKDVYDYFQAGVILFDLCKLKEEKVDLLFASLNELKRIQTPILSDQDVLNSVFNGKIKYLPTRWNIEWQILFEFPNYKKLMSSHDFKSFSEALAYPAIIHYASSVKPWNNPNLDLAHHWWVSARNTIYYEVFIKELCAAPSIPQNIHILRRLADKHLPKGTRRREFVKRIYHLIF